MVNATNWISQLQGFWASTRIYFERRLVFVFLMGFSSGFPLMLTGATLSIWLTEAGVTLTAIGLFALVGTPYSLKFIWAPFIDFVPIPLLSRVLGRRRAWMVLVQICLLISIVNLGSSQPEMTPYLAAVSALAVAFFSASQDIVIDAYRIEILDESQQGAGAAMTQAGYRVGLISSGAGALFLAEFIDWSVVYNIMAALVVISIAVTLRAPLPDNDDLSPATRSRHSWFRAMIIDPFVEFFTRTSPATAVIILAFILLYKLGDAFAGVMANPFYVIIGFSKIQIATVSKIFGVFATLLGVLLGGLIVKRYGVLKSLLGCGILQMLSNLMFALQAALGNNLEFLYLTIGIENLSGGMGSSAFVAYLSLLCNTAYTGTQFALFTSFMAFGRTWLSAGSGWIADQTDWITFFIISTGVALPGLLLLIWMMRYLPIHTQTTRRDRL